MAEAIVPNVPIVPGLVGSHPDDMGWPEPELGADIDRALEPDWGNNAGLDLRHLFRDGLANE